MLRCACNHIASPATTHRTPPVLCQQEGAQDMMEKAKTKGKEVANTAADKARRHGT